MSESAKQVSAQPETVTPEPGRKSARRKKGSDGKQPKNSKATVPATIRKRKGSDGKDAD